LCQDCNLQRKLRALLAAVNLLLSVWTFPVAASCRVVLWRIHVFIFY
jgi:hypothetical protein